MLDLIYYISMSLLTLFGFHRLFLLQQALRNEGPPEVPRQANSAQVRQDTPFVTVQLPIFNEEHVAERLIEAVCNLEYDRNKIEIQVLDDSTDVTTKLVAKSVCFWQQAGIFISHIRRTTRSGFKAGALANGMKTARGEFIAIFDADFIPTPSFLADAMALFTGNEIGMVQARWAHYNRHESLLTEAQAILLDGHFSIEQQARWRMGAWFNFNGTAGVWRRQCIEDAGGWSHDTLTEDLDLSYRAQMKGWTFRYADTLSVKAELPTQLSAFKNQQHRWSKGSIQVAQKLLLNILRGPYNHTQKFEAACHLLANLNYLFVSLLCICLPFLILNDLGQGWSDSVGNHLFLFGTFCFGAFYLASQIGQQPIGRALLLLPSVFALGLHLCLNNSRAVLEALLGHSSPFVRTPKTGDAHVKKTESTQTLSVIPFSMMLVLEAVLLLLYLVCFAICLRNQQWLNLPIVMLFCGALLVPLWSHLKIRSLRKLTKRRLV